MRDTRARERDGGGLVRCRGGDCGSASGEGGGAGAGGLYVSRGMREDGILATKRARSQQASEAPTVKRVKDRRVPSYPTEGHGSGSGLSPELAAESDAAEEGAARAVRAWLLLERHVRDGLFAWARAPQADDGDALRSARWRAVTDMLSLFGEFLNECSVVHPDSLHVESRVARARQGWDAIDLGLPEVVMAHLDRMAFARDFLEISVTGNAATVEERMFGEGALHGQLAAITREDWKGMSERWITAPLLSVGGEPAVPRDYGQAKVVFPVLHARKLTGMSFVAARSAGVTERQKVDQARELSLAAKRMLEAARKSRREARERARAER